VRSPPPERQGRSIVLLVDRSSGRSFFWSIGLLAPVPGPVIGPLASTAGALTMGSSESSASGPSEEVIVPTLSFDADTHDEMVRKVRDWLRSAEEPPPSEAGEIVERTAQLTKDAMSVIASAAPGPVAHSDVVAGLTRMGYEATDQTKRALLGVLNAVSELSGGAILRRVEGASRSVSYQMGSAAARGALRAVGARHA
jgi:hypothetical protein